MSQYLRCLVAGLFTNVAQRQPSASGGGGRGCYRTVIGGRRVPCSFGLRRRRVGRAAIVSSAVVCFASPSSGASTSWLFLAWRQVGVSVSLLLDHTDHTKGGLFFRHTVVLIAEGRTESLPRGRRRFGRCHSRVSTWSRTLSVAGSRFTAVHTVVAHGDEPSRLQSAHIARMTSGEARRQVYTRHSSLE